MEAHRPKTGRIELHNWRDFTKVMKIMEAGKWIYRGQEDAAWNLKSGLDRYLEKFEKSGQRGKDGSRNKLFLSTFPRAEYFAISRFQAMSREYQEWESDADALIAMQHYGAKTRLLDFTTSIMVALFFAYKTSANGKERAIYAINYKALAVDQDGIWSGYKKFLQEKYNRLARGDEQARFEFESQIENHYFRQLAFDEANKIISENTQEGAIDIIPLYTVCSNKRQTAQTGVELMPRTFDWFDKNLASALKVAVDEINNPSKLVSSDISHTTNVESRLPSALVKFVFDAEMEKDAWQFLDQANINAATIFPDLEGIAKSVRYSNSAMVDGTLGLANETLTITSLWNPTDKVTKGLPSDTILSIAKKMLDKKHSHVPILDEKGVVLGVFSESTMLEAWASGKECARNATLLDIKDFLSADRHKADVFKFVPKNTTIANLRKIYADAERENKRIGLVLVTENGMADEPLLGLLNVWDIPKEEGFSRAE